MNNNKIWAGIIVYYPDENKLINLLRLLKNQVDKVLIYNNGGLMTHRILRSSEICEYSIIGTGENLGIGVAVNAICMIAESNKISNVITFDQDSAPPSDMVERLYHFSKRLLALNIKLAAVGPFFVDKRNGETLFPIFQYGNWWIKKVYPVIGCNEAINTNLLITSGMLLNIKAWRQTHGFREDFFIDHVDTEWCIRAACHGFVLYTCPAIIMEHELSDGPPKRIFGRLSLKYSPIRRYYAFRNTVALIKENKLRRGLKNYLILTLAYRLLLNLVIDQNKLKSLHFMLTGICHGLIGKMGKK